MGGFGNGTERGRGAGAADGTESGSGGEITGAQPFCGSVRK
jgi:hypothetical protein